jgi:hypothetical protein
MTTNRNLTTKDKAALGQRVLDIHQGDPNRLRKVLPEMADLLDELAAPAYAPRRNQGLTGLTTRERNFHKEALDDAMRRFKSLTQEEAIKGLEHGANLLVDGFTPGYPSRQELLRLVRKATGIQPRKEGKPLEKAIREGNPSRIVPVVMGIDFHLTWDYKLVKVTMDPQRWRLRGQTISIIGIGQDTADDVAELHDDYLVDAYQNA